MEDIRCFVAIELPPAVKAPLVQLEDELRAIAGRSMKLVDPKGIHLTLKFLGGVPASRIAGIEQALAAAAQSRRSFSLHLADLGAFANWQRPQVVWIGLAGELAELAALQRDVEQRLAKLGFPPEDRDFAPHLTLARMRDDVGPAMRKELGERMSRVSPKAMAAFRVSALALMKSQLTPAGAIYSRLAEVPFVEPAGAG